eukprot:6205027-Pleurochrysis_carterae.AAC.2
MEVDWNAETQLVDALRRGARLQRLRQQQLHRQLRDGAHAVGDVFGAAALLQPLSAGLMGSHISSVSGYPRWPDTRWISLFLVPCRTGTVPCNTAQCCFDA